MYDISKVMADFDKLYSLYLNCTYEKEKNSIYDQMKFIFMIDKKLAREKISTIIKPENYQNDETIIRLDRFKKIEELTLKICSNADIFAFNGYSSSQFLDSKVTYDEFVKRILTFFNKYFPNDTSLAEKSINEQLILNRSYLFQSAYIMYLESIKKYYINIKYKGSLRNSDIINTVHELGHASVFNINKTYNQHDPILTESISYLYELLFIYDHIGKNNLNIEKELGYHFYKSLGDRLIYNHLAGNSKIISNDSYLSMLEALYGNIIAATLLLNNDRDELNKKIDFIKENYNAGNGFEVLGNVGIGENDLIDTSKNLRELVRKRP